MAKRLRDHLSSLATLAFIALVLCATEPVFASDCAGGSTITLSSQQSVDDFSNTHPNCSVIVGSLEVKGDDITHLDGLAGLERIEGSLSLLSPVLSSIDGLSSLSSIEGSLIIGQTSQGTLLESLSALSNLTSLAVA